MKQFSTFTDIPLSPTMAMNERAMVKKNAGECIYNLSAGEPSIDTPDVIIEVAYRAMKEGKTQYPPVMGIPELRDAVARWMNRMYHTDYTREETIVMTGGKHVLYAIVEAMMNSDDEAIIVAPFWVSYASMVELQGGKNVILQTEEKNGWKVLAEQIEEKITEKTKLMFFNNAGNPTGALFSRDKLEAIVKVCAKNNVLLVSDEVYSGLVYDDAEFVSAGSFPQYKNNVCVVQSASKNFAMTGWRVGFGFGPIELMDKLKIIQSQSTSGTSSISQYATLAAINHADDIISSIRNIMIERRNACIDTFNQLFHTDIQYPKSSLYCFLPLHTFGVHEKNSLQFCLDVLNTYNVAMVPGSAFGTEGYVRCSFGGRTEDIVAAITVLAEMKK